MSRISSQDARFYLEVGPDETPVAATAATAAKPCVLTLADTSEFTLGDFVKIAGSGWKSLDGNVFRVGALTATTLTLHGSDTSKETAAFGAGATVEKLVMMEVCFSTTTRQSPPAATIDVTTYCDTARRKVAGMPDTGTFTLEGFYDSEDAGYEALREAYYAGDDRAIAFVFRDDSSIQFIGQITSLGESFGVDQAVTISSQGNVNGLVTYGRAPVPAGP